MIEKLKRYFSYLPVISNLYDFDYSSVLDIEKYQLTRLRDCINSHKDYYGYEYDVSRINLAIKLLEKYNSYVNSYVNIKNAHRFLNNYQINHISKDLLKEELYNEKIWYLYHKIRVYYMRQWWD
jgi:hypothetical protein